MAGEGEFVECSPCVYDGRVMRSFIYSNEAFPVGHPFRNYSTLHTTAPSQTISFQMPSGSSRWHGLFLETHPIDTIQMTFDLDGRDECFWKTTMVSKINAMQWRGFDYHFRPILLTKLATKRWCTFHQAWHEG